MAYAPSIRSVSFSKLQICGASPNSPGPDGNPLEATYVFEARGDTLLGTVSTRMGGGPFNEGKIDGDKISFVVSYGNTHIEWNGTVSGDEIYFTRQNGEKVDQFTAKRAGG